MRRKLSISRTASVFQGRILRASPKAQTAGRPSGGPGRSRAPEQLKEAGAVVAHLDVGHPSSPLDAICRHMMWNTAHTNTDPTTMSAGDERRNRVLRFTRRHSLRSGSCPWLHVSVWPDAGAPQCVFHTRDAWQNRPVGRSAFEALAWRPLTLTLPPVATWPQEHAKTTRRETMNAETRCRGRSPHPAPRGRRRRDAHPEPSATVQRALSDARGADRRSGRDRARRDGARRWSSPGEGKAFCASHDLKEMRSNHTLDFQQRLFACVASS